MSAPPLRLPNFLTARNPSEALAACRRLADAEDHIVELDVRGTGFVDPFGMGSPTEHPAKTDEVMRAPEFEHQQGLIQYVFSELLNNALTHAQRHGFKGKARVWTAAQYYPSSDKVRLAVADTGCGLLATLKGHPQLESVTHFAAISAALQPRISCNRNLGVREDTVNEGIGLTTVHRIVDRCVGDMLVLTGNAYQLRSGGGLAQGFEVVVDFAGAAVTQSFVDELVGRLILERGPEVLQRIVFKNCSDDARAIIRFVAADRADQYLKTTTH